MPNGLESWKILTEIGLAFSCLAFCLALGSIAIRHWKGLSPLSSLFAYKEGFFTPHPIICWIVYSLVMLSRRLNNMQLESSSRLGFLGESQNQRSTILMISY